MLKKLFYYNSSVIPTPPSSYILDDISSTAVYAVSFSRYLLSSYVGQPVMTVQLSVIFINISFTVDDLMDGTAESLIGVYAASLKEIYNQVSGSKFTIVAGVAPLWYHNGFTSKPVDSFGKVGIRGKDNNLPRWQLPVNPYSGTNGALFDVTKPTNQDSTTSPRWAAIGNFAASPQVINKKDVISGAAYNTFHINGVDSSALTNLNASENVQSIFNMTGLNLTGWVNRFLWSGYGQNTVHMEQIYFSSFDPLERLKVENNQRDYYGYY